MAALPLYSIGHSNRELGAFIAALTDSSIECLVDVRAFPRSRTNPQFNFDVLPDALARAGIGYLHLPGLAGRRPKSTTVDPVVNGYWKVAGFHNYADYALTEAFQAPFRELLRTSSERRAAMMCAEVLWWRCHRRIITDYALAAGREVIHIFEAGHLEPARLNEGARVDDDRTVTYPRGPDEAPQAQVGA
ncbi:DUF488 domain-containing protein [Luteibacter sp.]|uniref:DUF488 domain-containing protein n=1 Tax=Luteibacter sp. TaxID=1886636 RepID=UPI003F7EA694